MYLSWIIPAHNEANRIEKTLREVDGYLRAKNFFGGYEILVVNNRSSDATSFLVERIKSSIPNIKLYDLEGYGKGFAVKHGMLVAKGEICLFSDADNSTAPENFDKMMPFFEKGYDVVVSSRDSKDAKGASRDVEEPRYREILGNLGNILIQVFGVWGVWDTQNGFKAFTSRAAKSIFSKSLMYGWSFDIEALALAKRMGYKMAIIPVRWRFEEDSKVTFGAYISVFLDVFKIRWNLITNRYKIDKS